MKTWASLLLLLVVVGAAWAEGGCDIDKPGLSESRSYKMVLEKLTPCFEGVVTEKMKADIKVAKSLTDFRSFFADFCPHAARVTTCMAGVRESLAGCENKNVTQPFAIISDLTEHLLTAGCEDAGERLAYLTSGTMLLAKERHTLVPFRQCIHKVSTFMKHANDADIDSTSESYILYLEAGRAKRCLKHVEDEEYKQKVQWFIDEVVATIKCQHPTEDHWVLCKDLDVSLVPVSDVCQLPPVAGDNLYERLEEKVVGCYAPILSHTHLNFNDTAELRADVKNWCDAHRDFFKCQLDASAEGETCLPVEEDKQFQLVVQAMNEATQRACVEDGAHTADVMLALHAAHPQYDDLAGECYERVDKASKAHEGHAASTKNMRFYHDVIAFKRCLVEKLHDDNAVVGSVGGMFDDVLKKMKCVNPGDDGVVLCDSIHVEEHGHH